MSLSQRHSYYYEYSRVPPGSSPAICFFCECCLSHIYDMSAAWHIPHSTDRYRSLSIICNDCIAARLLSRGRRFAEYSCDECKVRYRRWQKEMRVETGVVLQQMYDMQLLRKIQPLYLLLRDYLVEEAWIVKMTIRTYNRQTLPRAIVKKMKTAQKSDAHKSVVISVRE